MNERFSSGFTPFHLNRSSYVDRTARKPQGLWLSPPLFTHPLFLSVSRPYHPPRCLRHPHPLSPWRSQPLTAVTSLAPPSPTTRSSSSISWPAVHLVQSTALSTSPPRIATNTPSNACPKPYATALSPTYSAARSSCTSESPSILTSSPCTTYTRMSHPSTSCWTW